MATEKEIKQANAAYKNLCRMLDNMGWSYNKDETERLIKCSASGDDLPIDITIDIHEENSLIIFESKIFQMPEDRLVDGTLAVNVLNASIINGTFVIDFNTNEISFRLVSSFVDSLIGQEAYEYILGCSCATVDKFNHVLPKYASGEMNLRELYDYAQCCWDN